MANRVKTVAVSAVDRAELERCVRSQTGSARDARRARIVLLAAEGRPAAEIAELVGCSVNTVGAWRSAYVDRGLAGLADRARSGRPARVVDADKQREVLWHTLLTPPDDLGVTHWSSRLLARRVGLHFTQVARVWRHWEIQPWREETFKFFTDPELEAKVRDVVGLCLHPRAPRGADDLSGSERPSPPDLSQQGRRSWGQPDSGGAGKGGSSSDNAGTCQDCQMVRARQA